jgi:hypothetical protein
VAEWKIVRRVFASWLNQVGLWVDARSKRLGSFFYSLASLIDPAFSAPWYNRGLIAKYRRKWEESLRCNQKAVSLNPGNEAAWWNFGIAATALHDWPEAWRAWQKYGVQLDEGTGEVTLPVASGCARLNPDPEAEGEVVWGERIDPARFVVLNVPLLGSNHRYRDIILNDGAPRGTRENNGEKFDVFNELEVWQASEYKTFEADLEIPSEPAERQLSEICRKYDLGIEDWSTVRMLCAKCSLGDPGPHECAAKTASGVRRNYALAANNIDEVVSALREWTATVENAAFGEVKQVYPPA